MSATFKIHNLITLTARFNTEDGVPVDPTTVTLRLMLDEGGSVATYVYLAGPEIVRLSAGVYVFEYDPPFTGEYLYQWRGTGSCTAMNETSFEIEKSTFGDT